MKLFRRIVPLVAVTLAAAGCREEPAPERSPAAGAAAEARGWRYERAYTFVGERAGEPLVVPFAFRAVPRGSRYERTARGWLAHGATWDAFLEERWSSPQTGGVWRVLPHGSLRVAAGGRTGIEALWFEAGERRLRVQLADPVSVWNGGERERFRILDGTLTLGAEEIDGLVVEELQATRPSTRGEPGTVTDRIVLRDEEGLALYLLHRQPYGTESGATESWALVSADDQPLRRATVRWPEVRSLEQARRDVPLRWTIDLPDAELTGEVQAVGYDVGVGEERGARRSVEVGYTVEGWLERNGERVPVWGTVRHEQG